MAHIKKLWIRKVRETRVFLEVFEATSGAPGYVEKDGTLQQRLEAGTPVIETVEEFRELSHIEQVLFQKSNKETN